MKYTIQIPQELLEELKERLNYLNKLINDLGLSEYTFKQYEKIFSNYGWFIPYDISVPDAVILLGQFENKEINKANKFLVDYFKKDIESIKSKLINDYPEREKIFLEAFKAHKKSMFYASTILFLSQADGITNSQIFMGSKFREFKKKNEEHSLVNIFDKGNPLTDYYNKESQNSNYKNDLNRHGTVHGFSLDYGTKLNSYKAISLLSFISNLREKIND